MDVAKPESPFDPMAACALFVHEYMTLDEGKMWVLNADYHFEGDEHNLAYGVGLAQHLTKADAWLICAKRDARGKLDRAFLEKINMRTIH